MTVIRQTITRIPDLLSLIGLWKGLIWQAWLPGVPPSILLLTETEIQLLKGIQVPNSHWESRVQQFSGGVPWTIHVPHSCRTEHSENKALGDWKAAHGRSLSYNTAWKAVALEHG